MLKQKIVPNTVQPGMFPVGVMPPPPPPCHLPYHQEFKFLHLIWNGATSQFYATNPRTTIINNNNNSNNQFNQPK